MTRATGHRTGELAALTGLGQIQEMQGRYAQAIDYFSGRCGWPAPSVIVPASGPR
jgi:hypothetical protein